MRRDVGGAISRLRTDLRVTAAERYRSALVEQSRLVPILMLVAAVFDRLGSLARLLGRVRDPRVTDPSTAMLDRVHTAGRRLRARRPLTVVRAAVGGTDELSLTLTGPPAACATVRGVELVGAGGSVPLPAAVSRHGGLVRVVAVFRPEYFSADEAAYRIAVTDGSRELAVGTPSRAALVERWDARVFAAQRWPARIVLDAQRHLMIEGRAPRSRSIQHTVAVGLTGAVITWTAPGEGPAQVRCIPRGKRSTVVVDGRRGSGATCTATLDLLTLAEHDDTVWDVSVPGALEGWLPLLLLPGEYPGLRALPDSLAVSARRPDGSAVHVRVGYTDRNQLCVRVGPRR